MNGIEEKNNNTNEKPNNKTDGENIGKIRNAFHIFKRNDWYKYKAYIFLRNIIFLNSLSNFHSKVENKRKKRKETNICY